MCARPASDPAGLVWLFDVDGTLLTTDGAAHEAFALAVGEVLGVDDDLADIAFAGRTEPLILRDILAKHGRTFMDGDEARFFDRVFHHMHARYGPARGRLMPGIPELLDAVDRESRWVPALLTGNMGAMAEIKLRRFGLWERFAFGAYGDMAEDRDALARLAVRRARNIYGVPPERCIVVGDTEHDVRCARAAGARVVAVATGSRSRATLEAAEPDLMLDDLANPSPLLDFARSIEAG